MQIRKMNLSDKKEVLAMMSEFYASPALLHHSPAHILEKDFDDCVSDLPFAEGYVFIKGDRIAGYSIISKGYSTEYGGISIMIEDWFVKSEYRGQGIGKQYFDYIEKAYRDIAVRIRLEVEPANFGAIKLYEKCGYENLPYKQMTKELL